MSTKIQSTEPKPIRQAGESIRNKLDEMWLDMFADQLAVGFVLIMSIFVLWLGVIFDYTVKQAAFFTLVGLIYFLWLCVQFRKRKRVYGHYKKGLLGERLVEEQLDEIRKAGFDVFHDFILKDENCTENIDHIIVGPSGIFTLETKNWRAKGAPQDDRITFDGETLKIGAHTQEEKVLKQPRRQAAKLQAILQPVTQDPLWVVPILCFWDRYVQLTRFNPTGLQVLNQKGISSFILSREQKFTPETVRKISSKLRELNRAD